MMKRRPVTSMLASCDDHGRRSARVGGRAAKLIMGTKRFTGAIAIAVGFTLPPESTFAQQVKVVNCNRGDSIQAILDKPGGHTGELNIFVTGICVEDIVIARDGVSIFGSGNATLKGTVEVQGLANHTHVADMKFQGTGNGTGIRTSNSNLSAAGILVTGYQTGLIAQRNGAINLSNSQITDNTGIGVLAQYNAALTLIDSQVINNNSSGILAEIGSTLDIQNSVINGNAIDGIVVENGSSANVDFSTISQNNRGIVAAVKSSVWINGSDIEYNKGSGMVVDNNSTARIQLGTKIRENGNVGLFVALHSTVDIFSGDTSITDNVAPGLLLVRDAGVLTGDGVQISGNGEAAVRCGDTESSFVSDSLSIEGDIECSDFDQALPPSP